AGGVFPGQVRRPSQDLGSVSQPRAVLPFSNTARVFLGGPARARWCLVVEARSGSRWGSTGLRRPLRLEVGVNTAVNLEVENPAVGGPQVEDGCRPLQSADVVDGFAGLAHACNDSQTVGHSGVELTGECDGSSITDLELHRHDGRDALLYETHGHPGEGIAPIVSGSFAGVEHNQAQRFGVMQTDPETLAAHPGAGAVISGEQHHPLALSFGKASVAAEAQSVVVVPTQL